VESQAAAKASPKWDKAHWRCGAALLAARRAPEAVAAFHRCYACSDGVRSHTVARLHAWPLADHMSARGRQGSHTLADGAFYEVRQLLTLIIQTG